MNQLIPPFAKPTRKRATKLGSAGRSCSSNCHSIVIVTERSGVEGSRGDTDRLPRLIESLARGQRVALSFAFQLSRESTRVVDLSKRLDNGGGINRDGARLCVRVSAIGHE